MFFLHFIYFNLYIDFVCKSTSNFCANLSNTARVGSLQNSERALPEIGHSLYLFARNRAYLIIQVGDYHFLGSNFSAYLFFTFPHVVVSNCGCGEIDNGYAGSNQSPPEFALIFVNCVGTSLFISTLKICRCPSIFCV